MSTTPSIGPQPGKLNLVIRQGSTFDQTLTWKDSTGTPIDLTGYAARAQVREETSSTVALVSLTSSPAAGITLGGALGTIRMQISATATAALDFEVGVWDLEMEIAGVVTPLLAGCVTLEYEVTR